MENKLLKAIIALMLTVAFGVGVYLTLTVSIPVLKTPVTPGTVIFGDNIDNVRVLRTSISSDFAADIKDVAGKTSTIDIAANTPILKIALEIPAEKSLETEYPDMAIITIPVRADHVPSDLDVGDEINLIVYLGSGIAESREPFTIGFNHVSIVNSIKRDSNGDITRIDVLTKKNMTVDLSAAVSLGDIFVIKNLGENSINLQGTTPSDLLVKYYAEQVEEINEAISEVEVYEEFVEEE